MKDLHNAVDEVMAEIVSACRDVPRVLHVDGNADAALVLATLLVPETQVSHASSLADAEAALAEGQYALVVLDPDLPDGDGASLIYLLQRLDDQRGHSTPVLLYSARHPGLHTQAHAFLPKPWTSPRQLWRTISHMLGIAPYMQQELIS